LTWGEKREVGEGGTTRSLAFELVCEWRKGGDKETTTDIDFCYEWRAAKIMHLHKSLALDLGGWE